MNTSYQVWYLNKVVTQFMEDIVNINGSVRSRTQVGLLIKYLTSPLNRRPRNPLVNVPLTALMPLVSPDKYPRT